MKILTFPVGRPGQRSGEAPGGQAVVLSGGPQLNASRGHVQAGRRESAGQRSLRLGWGFHLQDIRTGGEGLGFTAGLRIWLN